MDESTQEEQPDVEAFRDRAVALLRDLAEQERAAHRAVFDLSSRIRADAFDRAAEMILCLSRVGGR